MCSCKAGGSLNDLTFGTSIGHFFEWQCSKHGSERVKFTITVGCRTCSCNMQILWVSTFFKWWNNSCIQQLNGENGEKCRLLICLWCVGVLCFEQSLKQSSKHWTPTHLIQSVWQHFYFSLFNYCFACKRNIPWKCVHCGLSFWISILLKLWCVWILFQNASSQLCFCLFVVEDVCNSFSVNTFII